MQLGVVVPTFNRKRKTMRFLDCFANQTRRDFRLYMVDSGSTDGTREMLAAHPLCRLLRATPRQWWAGAMNLGVKQAFRDGCDVILTINDDAAVKPDYVASFAALFEKYDCQILSNRIDYSDDPGRIWSLGSYTLWNTPLLFKLRFCGARMEDLPLEIASRDIAPAMTACGDGMLVRKDVYDRIGLYAERGVKFLHGDSEFTLRAQKAGIPIHVAPNIVLYNDVYNDDVNPLDKLPDASFWRAAFTHFFSVRSYAYLRTVFFIIARHCPWGAKLKTAIKFVLFELFVLSATRRPGASAETAQAPNKQEAAQKAPKFLMRILRAVVNPDCAVNLDGAHLQGDMREINDLRRIRAKAERMAAAQRKMEKAPQAYGE
jgi:GT2 family glycosyltransferase